MSLNVKWILFDFGGCLDSDGLHSRTLFYNQFKNFGLISPDEDCNSFQDAYTYSDRKVITESLIAESSLAEMNEIMCTLIAEKLSIGNFLDVQKVANAITKEQGNYLKRNKSILEKIKLQYKLGIISNFSGNLIKILDEFSLTPYFSFVLDSYHIGASKPDPRIFKLALKHCETDAKEICFVGDNIERDVEPAYKLGMKTILLNPILKDSSADYTLSSLEELLALTQIK